MFITPLFKSSTNFTKKLAIRSLKDFFERDPRFPSSAYARYDWLVQQDAFLGVTIDQIAKPKSAANRFVLFEKYYLVNAIVRSEDDITLARIASDAVEEPFFIEYDNSDLMIRFVAQDEPIKFFKYDSVVPKI